MSSPSEEAVIVRPAQGPRALTLTESEKLATHFAKSGFFADARDVSKAVVKITLGQSMGLDPATAMMGIFLNGQGKLSMSANLMAAVIKKSGKYDYKVVSHTNDGCVLEFLELRDGKWVPAGQSSFTKKDAEQAGFFTGKNAHNYKAYPRNMYFARAMSNGAKWHCPDAFGGCSPYLPDEVSTPGVRVDPETLDAEVVAVSAPATQKSLPQAPAVGKLKSLLAECELTKDWVEEQFDVTCDDVSELGDKVLASAIETLERRKKLSANGSEVKPS